MTSIPATWRWLKAEEEPGTTVDALQQEIDDLVWLLDHPPTARYVDVERQRERRLVLKRQLEEAQATLDLAIAQESSKPVVDCERCGDPHPCTAVGGEWVCARCAP